VNLSWPLGSASNLRSDPPPLLEEPEDPEEDDEELEPDEPEDDPELEELPEPPHAARARQPVASSAMRIRMGQPSHRASARASGHWS
jgi:hypothetical protein